MCAETLLGKASNGRDVAQENVARKINPTKRYRGKTLRPEVFRGEERHAAISLCALRTERVRGGETSYSVAKRRAVIPVIREKALYQ